MTDLVLSDQMVADWARTAITTSASAHVVILAGEVQRLRAQLATVTAQRDSYYERGLAMAGERLLAEAERPAAGFDASLETAPAASNPTPTPEPEEQQP